MTADALIKAVAFKKRGVGAALRIGGGRFDRFQPSRHPRRAPAAPEVKSLVARGSPCRRAGNSRLGSSLRCVRAGRGVGHDDGAPRHVRAPIIETQRWLPFRVIVMLVGSSPDIPGAEIVVA